MLRWKLINPFSWVLLQDTPELLIWFTWPAWPLTLWTLWRWRQQLHSRHLALPIWFVVVPGAAAIASMPLIATCCLHARIGLPGRLCTADPQATAQRLDRLVSRCCSSRVAYSLSGWSGLPCKQAYPRNRQPTLPDWPQALHPTTQPVWWRWRCWSRAWVGLRWRVRRHRAAIWKSLVLPAGGVTVSLFLALSLWMPLLNYAQKLYLVAAHAGTDQPQRIRVRGIYGARSGANCGVQVLRKIVAAIAANPPTHNALGCWWSRSSTIRFLSVLKPSAGRRHC